jgi:hypothetical protein
MKKKSNQIWKKCEKRMFRMCLKKFFKFHYFCTNKRKDEYEKLNK